jgi:putative phage-type endonuclease
MTQTAQSFDVEERRSYLGASEIAAVLGLDKWRTPLDVYNDKLGLTPSFEGNNHTERGNRLEAVAAEYYTELTGRKLRRYSRGYSHKQHEFIRGHIDRIVENESQIAEIKCPSIAAYRKIQREGLPDSWQIQMQAYMGISGHKKAVIIVFCADAWDLLHFEVDFDPIIYNPAIDGAVRFWRTHVLAGIPPELANGKKAEFEIAKTGGTVTLRDDEKFIEAAMLLREAIQLEKDAAELKELAKNKALEAVESVHGGYEGAGVRFYFSQKQGRKSFDKKRLAAENPNIDLSLYETVSNPYDEFRTYLISQ